MKDAEWLVVYVDGVAGKEREQGNLRECVLPDEKGTIVLSVRVGATPIYTCHCRCHDDVVPPQ